MRLVLVISEASLWKPGFVRDLIERLPHAHRVVGAVLTSFQPRGVSKQEHLRRYLVMLGPLIFVRMAVRETVHSLANALDRLRTLPRPQSIEGVCRRHGIPTTFARNVNAERTIRWIQEREPDILLSSGNQIFGQALLSVPTKACLNRHTSLLPAYGGIYPIFWCMLNDEEYVGVSVHTMTAKLDEGVVLAQRKLRVQPEDTFFSLFGQCFRLSVDAVIEAVEKVARGDLSPVASTYEPSYYSYPSHEDVRRFRKKGKRML